MTNNVQVKIGDSVVLLPGSGQKGSRRGTVSKVGRVWINIHLDGLHESHAERYRLDTQTDGSKFGAPARFMTIPQWEEREAQRVARERLQDFGIDFGIWVDRDSPWVARLVELAELLERSV
jgi:hypothetical protein